MGFKHSIVIGEFVSDLILNNKSWDCHDQLKEYWNPNREYTLDKKIEEKQNVVKNPDMDYHKMVAYLINFLLLQHSCVYKPSPKNLKFF